MAPRCEAKKTSRKWVAPILKSSSQGSSSADSVDNRWFLDAMPTRGLSLSLFLSLQWPAKALHPILLSPQDLCRRNAWRWCTAEALLSAFVGLLRALLVDLLKALTCFSSWRCAVGCTHTLTHIHWDVHTHSHTHTHKTHTHTQNTHTHTHTPPYLCRQRRRLKRRERRVCSSSLLPVSSFTTCVYIALLLVICICKN
jgi:hypothetical protein